MPGNKVRKDSRALEHASYAGLSEKWVSACDLKRGDKVLLSDGTLCEVEGVSCKKLSAPETTYNLEVADFHTYYVSDACVLVHNAGTCGTGVRHTDDQKAIVQLAKESKRSGGITKENAKTLMKWADEYQFPVKSRGPELSKNINSIWGKVEHYHIAGVDHIPLIK